MQHRIILGVFAIWAFVASIAVAATPPPLKVTGSVAGTLTANAAGKYTGTIDITMTATPIDSGILDGGLDASVDATRDASLDAASIDAGRDGSVDASLDAMPIDASPAADALPSLGINEPAITSTPPMPGGKIIATSPFILPTPTNFAIEPDMGTTIRRLPAGFVTIYSQSQAFTTDKRFVMLAKPGVGYFAFTYPGLVQVTGGNWSDPKVLPNTHTIIHLDWSGGVFKVMAMNLDTVVDGELMRLPEFVSADSNVSFEDISQDGRYMTVYGIKADGGRYFTVIDLVAKTALYEFDHAKMFAPNPGARCQPDPQWGPVDPDWFAVSPLSHFLIIQWKGDGTAACRGTEVFDLTSGAFIRQIGQRHDHGDLGIDHLGREVYVTFTEAYPGNANYGGFVVHHLDGTQDSFVRILDWGAFEHISCRGIAGSCVVSAGLMTGKSFDREIYLIALADGSASHLAHHRSTEWDGYWSEPKPTVSRDGQTVLVSTDWGKSGAYESFAIELPPYAQSASTGIVIVGGLAFVILLGLGGAALASKSNT